MSIKFKIIHLGLAKKYYSCLAQVFKTECENWVISQTELNVNTVFKSEGKKQSRRLQMCFKGLRGEAE